MFTFWDMAALPIILTGFIGSPHVFIHNAHMHSYTNTTNERIRLYRLSTLFFARTQNLNHRVAGIRADRFGENGEDVWLPRASLSLAMSQRLKLSAAYSQQAQFPDFAELYGEFRNLELRAERTSHWIVALEHLLSEKVRFRIEGYDVKARTD